jgi:hypothetical protein
VTAAAVALFERLHARGVRLRVDGLAVCVTPAHVLTEDDAAAIRALKAELIVLLNPEARIEVFQSQLDAWRADGRVGVPFFALAGISPPSGCLSCGLALPPDCSYRCEACAAAVGIVLDHDRTGDAHD